MDLFIFVIFQLTWLTLDNWLGSPSLLPWVRSNGSTWIFGSLTCAGERLREEEGSKCPSRQKTAVKFGLKDSQRKFLAYATNILSATRQIDSKDIFASYHARSFYKFSYREKIKNISGIFLAKNPFKFTKKRCCMTRFKIKSGSVFFRGLRQKIFS